MHCAWTCAHTHTHQFVCKILPVYWNNLSIQIPDKKEVYQRWVVMCFGCHHYAVCWCVLAVTTVQCSDVFLLSSLCSMLMCFGCHHCATSWCFESFVPSTKHIISRMMEAAASSVHPPCHRQQDPLQVVHFYHTTHCTSLNAAVSTSHFGV